MFAAAIVVKAANGVLEIVAGYFLVFKPGWIGPATAVWATTLLLRDSANLFAQVLARWGVGLTLDTEHFASTYLIAHGVAKVFVAWGLLREKLWAFPAGLAIFGLLILYQLYHFAIHSSVVLALLIALDCGVCYLIWREYGFRRKTLEPAERTEPA
jgi:uncharacterized membrane protein